MSKRSSSKLPNPQRLKPLNLARSARLGKYRLQKRLGKGGFCEVWKAKDLVEGIDVALKIPLADSHGKRDNQAILREVRLIARLHHPNILPFKNADLIQGHAVLATELSVDTLADRSKPMSTKRILAITIQVLRALEHTHKHRLVHCDVNPNNIFLFSQGRAALGDFGIGQQFTPKMQTIDDFGTPGYVAPEQAFGKPLYASDCFSVALILYEYITGHLPRWPFRWPLRGAQRLKDRAGSNITHFLKRALQVDPQNRFADAAQMLAALEHALPHRFRTIVDRPVTPKHRTPNWQQLRRQTFLKRYQPTLPQNVPCANCGEPLNEPMTCCPWCGTTENRFDRHTPLSHFCPRCRKGMLPQWRFCPWCHGPGFEPQPPEPNPKLATHEHCRHCHTPLARFMRYCPQCRRKIQRPWQAPRFPEICSKCHWPVDSEYWNYCPWCTSPLRT